MWTFKENIVFKKSGNLAQNSGEEAFGITLPQVKIDSNRYCCSSMATNGSLKA